MTTAAKAAVKKAKIEELKAANVKTDESERFLKKGKERKESPTNMKMMNTSLMKNNNPSFDNYALQMKKRKLGTLAGSSFKNRSKDDLSVGGDPLSVSAAHDFEDPSTLKINQLVPQARDGHSTVLHKDMLVIFGGDRHHTPFNDLFMVDLDDFFFSKEAD